MDYVGKSFRVTVNVPDRAALEREVSFRLAQGTGFALATLNLDHLVKLGRCARFRAAYAAQDLVTADGNPVVWMSRLAGAPVELVPGSDSIVPLARVAAAQGVPIALVGSTDATLAAAARRLEAEVPGLQVVARIAPEMGFDPEGAAAAQVFDRVGSSGAGLCLLAFGAPKQEMLAAVGRRRLPTMGFVSVGAGLDFIAGTQERAPRWMRRLALEWLWRALSQPARLGPRYLRCMAILPGQAWNALAQRWAAQAERSLAGGPGR